LEFFFGFPFWTYDPEWDEQTEEGRSPLNNMTLLDKDGMAVLKEKWTILIPNCPQKYDLTRMCTL